MQSWVLLAALLVPEAHVATDGSIRFDEFGPFLVHSTATGQLSSATQELRVNTLAELQVKYVAPAEHCSSARMHFYLDGTERGVSAPVAPGKSSGYFDFGGVSAGEHVVGLRAEGLPGGCNVGQLSSWGGYAVVRTTVETGAGLDARAAALGPVIFYWTSVNYSWGRHRQGVFVTADGDVFAFHYEPAERDWSPAARITLFDLQERLSHHTRWLLKVNPQEIQGTQDREIRYDGGSEDCGVYRLDEASGSYVNLRAGQSLCRWLEMSGIRAERG